MSLREFIPQPARMAVRAFRDQRRDARLRALYKKYKADTMIARDTFVANLRVAKEALENPALAQGCIIECGTWRGGMSAALMEIGGHQREYYFFDSFEGLPLVKEIDGPAAADWQANTEGAHYYDNCRTSEASFSSTISQAGVPSRRVHIFKGFYEETLPYFKSPPIAVLRLDADWYDSTMICLTNLWDHVLPGGLILIDDYYTWDGCSRAIHDFLSAQKSPARILQKDERLATIIKPGDVADTVPC